MVGDWNCDGIDTPGLYRQSDGFVYLRNSNTQGVADIRFFFGNPSGHSRSPATSTATVVTPSRIYRACGSPDLCDQRAGRQRRWTWRSRLLLSLRQSRRQALRRRLQRRRGRHRRVASGVDRVRLLPPVADTPGIADSSFFFGDPGDRLVAGDWGVVDNVRVAWSLPALRSPNSSSGTAIRRATPTNRCPSGSFQHAPGGGRLGSSSSAWEGCCRSRSSASRFAQQLSPVGGTPPYTVTKLGGPAFLSVDNSGVVFGTASLGWRLSTSR